MNPSNSFASAAAGRTRFPFTLPGVIAIVALYASVHALTRLLASGNLGEDDPLDSLLVQTLAPGYGVHQGPLYDWVLWLVQQVVGTGLPGFLMIKYSLLVVIASLAFQITRRLTGSATWAFIAVESMATVYQIFWRFHEGFTHRVGAMALCVATAWAMLRLVDRPSRSNYLLFAILIGLGLLSEHIYAFALFATLFAAWLQPAMRRTVFSLPMLAALPVAMLIVSPYALWLLAEPQRAITLGTALFPKIPAHTLAGLAGSLRDALIFPVLVLSPYIVLLPLVFPAIFRTIFKQSPLRSSDPSEPDPKLFLQHLLLIELTGLILFNGFLYSRSNYAVHSILPMLVVAIPWLTEKARQTDPSRKRIRAFMAILLAFTITAYTVRSGNLFVYEPFCSRCRWGVPYADLADRLRELGFTDGTVMTNDALIGGNLRRFFPEAHFILTDGEATPADAGPKPGKLAVIWASSDSKPEMPPALQRAVTGVQALPAPQRIQLPWRHRWKPKGYRSSSWAAVITEVPR